MTIKPFKYQKEGVDFLANGTYQKLLADEMGLGKTPQLIWAAQKVRAKNILVVSPAVAKINWQNEFLKFAGLKAAVYDSPNDIKNGIGICSFNFATNYLDELAKLDLDLLIVDEAHFLKEPTAKRTKAVLGNGGLIHKAKRAWFATGTPAPNHAGELWVLLYTFGLTKLSYDGFISRYCNVHTVGNSYYSRTQISGTKTQHAPELKSLLKLCALRRLKRDELDLPPVMHSTFNIKGDDDAQILKQYPELKEKLRLEIEVLQDAIGFAANVSDEKLLSALGLMSQSISSLRRYHGLKKVKPAAELISQELLAKEYEKIILFGIHADVLFSLFNELKTFNPVIITGKVNQQDRQHAVERFQKDDSCQVFIGNIMAAGTAITLTAASQVVFIEQDFVPGNNAQAADRAHRIGQTMPVSVRHLAIAGGLDEKITAALARKTAEISTFIEK